VSIAPFVLMLLAGSTVCAKIDWQVVSSGGNNSGESTNYRLAGTAGQTVVGKGTATGSEVNHGFWQDISGSPICVAQIS